MTSTPDRERPSIDSVLGESISALVDNQGNELDLARVLKASDADPSSRAQWQRFHQISAAIRGEDVSFAHVDISAKIRASLADEAVVRVADTPVVAAKPWLHLLGKSSIAAAVALGVLVGVQQLGPQSVVPSDAVVAESEPFVAPDLNSAVVPAGFDSPALSARTVSTGPATLVRSGPGTQVQGLPAQQQEPFIADPQLQAHFDRLMMIHAQEASANSDISVMPFARLTDLNALDDDPAVTSEEGRAVGDP